MAYLDGLKVVAAVKNNRPSPVVHRRNKVIEKLQIQIDCAKAKLENREHLITTLRTKKTESGEKTHVEHVQKIKPWWYRNTDGKLIFEVRYANKRLELAKGKTGIEIENISTLIPAIELMIKAVETGELDKSLNAVANDIRAEIAK